MSQCKTYRASEAKKIAKVRYVTKEEAAEAIQKLYSCRPNDVAAVQPYKCNTCGFWHFGRPSARKTKSMSGYSERQLRSHEEILVGKLVGVLRGTYPAKPRTRKAKS